MSKTKKMILSLVFITGALLLIFVGGLYYWTNQSYEPTQNALQAMVTNESVAVNEDDLLVFTPIGQVKNTGFILYPGGLVEPASYSPLASLLAQNGYTVVIVPMPFNLAVLDANAAQTVIDSFDHIQNWAIGGHSLGGVMAINFAATHDSIKGVALYASYPMDEALKEKDISVISLWGSEDQVADTTKIIQSDKLLPADTQFIEIIGGNHGQFGSYGPQDGDGQATITEQEQLNITVNHTLDLLNKIAD